MCQTPRGSTGEGREATINRVTGNGRYGGGGWAGRYRRRRVSRRQTVPLSGPPLIPLTLGTPGNSPLSLKLLLLNARSVNNKTCLIQDLILDEKADLVCITETWLGELGGVNLSQICPPGFRVLQQPRLQGRGGGVAMVYRDSIRLTGYPVQQSTRFECLRVVLEGRDRIGILLVYRPPSCPTDSLPELTELVSSVVLESPRLLVLGDFNVHAEAPGTAAAQDFMASMATMGLSQRISAPTHDAGHTLDLVFTAGQVDDDLEVEEIKITPLSWTDHFLVGFRLLAAPRLCNGRDRIL